jgi:signal transduction histidine kinase
MKRWQGALARLSLGTRLLLASTVSCAVILLVAGFLLVTTYRTFAERGFDERLQIYVKELAADLAAPNDITRSDFGSIGEPRFELPISGWYWQVIQLDAAPRFSRFSRSLSGLNFQSLADRGLHSTIGERRQATLLGPDDRTLRVVERVIDLNEEGRYRITVAGNADEIRADIQAFQTMLWVTFALLGSVLAASTLVQVRFGLRPLDALRAEVVAIRRGETDRVSGAYPDDLVPLSRELNHVLEANREIVDRSRTQVGNLAHALKTPLSILVNEAAMKDNQLAIHVRDQAAVMSQQVTHYLNRARAAATAATAGALGIATDSQPVCESLVRMFEALHRERGLAVSFVSKESARIRCERQDLEEMLGNLIDNACKWANARVTLDLVLQERPQGTYAVFLIDDDGPGLTPEARERSVRRGQKLDESKPGSGLGLSIVVDLAGLYKGELKLESAEAGGLRAMLALPAA